MKGSDTGFGAKVETYILFYVFLAMLESGLTKLRGDLGCGIVHKLPVGTKDIAAGTALLLIRCTASTVGLAHGLRGARRRRG